MYCELAKWGKIHALLHLVKLDKKQFGCLQAACSNLSEQTLSGAWLHAVWCGGWVVPACDRAACRETSTLSHVT